MHQPHLSIASTAVHVWWSFTIRDETCWHRQASDIKHCNRILIDSSPVTPAFVSFTLANSPFIVLQRPQVKGQYVQRSLDFCCIELSDPRYAKYCETIPLRFLAFLFVVCVWHTPQSSQRYRQIVDWSINYFNLVVIGPINVETRYVLSKKYREPVFWF